MHNQQMASAHEELLRSSYSPEYRRAALQERQRLARELHDSVSQTLYGIDLCARNARETLEDDPQQAMASLEHVIQFAGQAMAEMQALLFDLRADALQTAGLLVALNKEIAVLRSSYRLNVEATLGGEPVISLEIKHALYRIAQEALHNVVRHAHARLVTVLLITGEEEMILEVRDDGKGFDTANQAHGRLGLSSMRERVLVLNGTLAIESQPGQGTCVRACIPIRASDLLIVGKVIS